MSALAKIQQVGQFKKPTSQSAHNRKAGRRLLIRQADYLTTGKNAPHGAYHRLGSWKK